MIDIDKLLEAIQTRLEDKNIKVIDASRPNWDERTVAYRYQHEIITEKDFDFLVKHLVKGILHTVKKDGLDTVGDLGIHYKPYKLICSAHKHYIEVIFFTQPVTTKSLKTRKK